MVQCHKLKSISCQQLVGVPNIVRFGQGRTIPLDGMLFGYTLREPIGVVGAVIPCALHAVPQQA
jgi:hypothetical protein